MDPTAAQRRERNVKIRRVLVIELLLNLLVAACKGIYGLLSGSLTITADAVHSTVDASANVVALFVVRKSGEPPDRDHPYGHRKFEVLAAAALGLAIAGVGINLGLHAISSLRAHSDPPRTDFTGVVVILGTLAVNIFVASYEARKARQLDSKFLAADAAHTLSDVLVTIAVMISYGASHIGLAWADGVGALLVVLIILRVAWKVTRGNLDVLVDRSQVDEESIRRTTLAIEGVESCHRIRSHGLPDEIRLDLHVQADGAMNLDESHKIAHQVESALRAENPRIIDVVVHMEPDGDPVEDI